MKTYGLTEDFGQDQSSLVTETDVVHSAFAGPHARYAYAYPELVFDVDITVTITPVEVQHG